MNESISDIIKKTYFQFGSTNQDSSEEKILTILKPQLNKLNILNIDLFFNELSIENSLKKLSEFKFEKEKNNLAFVQFTNKKISNQKIEISYDYYQTKIGKILIASTKIGICYLAFETIQKPALPYLQEIYTNCYFKQNSTERHQSILKYIDGFENIEITFHIKGTPFQFEIWKTLLEIPKGKLTSYGEIAKKINKSKAYRAVGTAIGKNPISFIIPCHRVIQINGKYGGYMWGIPKKLLLIGWESLQAKQ